MNFRNTMMVTAGLILACHTTESLGQEANFDDGFVLLDPILLQGDKVNRELTQATAGTTIIDGDVASQPQNIDLDDVLDDQANVLANEGFSLPSIRGIDSTSGGRPSISAGSQPRTPILIDDMALPSNESSAISQVGTWDVSAVEVARGPQPTSTGRNAIGGAIRVYTNDPVFDTEAATRVRYYDQVDTFSGAFMVNTPLIEDTLALRVVGEGSLGETYVDIVPTVPAGFDPEEEKYGRLRGKLLLQPGGSSRLSILGSIDHLENEQPTQGFVNDVKNIRIDDTVPFALVASYEDVTQTIYQVKSTYEFNDRLRLIGRFAYLDNDLVFRDTQDVINFGFPFVLGETGFDKNQTEGEAYLQFEDIGLARRGVLGVIHNTENEDGYNTGTLEFSADGQIKNTGIYGEVELSADRLVQGLTFIGGGRLEIDDRYRLTEAPLGNPTGNADFNETEFLPKLGVRYDANADASFGYTYTQGFRAGGLDVDLTAPIFGLPLSTSVFEPEFIDQHEIYGRGTFLDGKLDLSATGFYYEWENAQVDGAAAFFDGAVSLIGNVPEAIGYGAEFNASYGILPNFEVNAALGLLKTEITDPGPALAQYKGAALPRAPEITTSLGLTWYPIENLAAGFDIRHIGSNVTGLGQPELASYTVADVSLGYLFQSRNAEFELEGFINNVFDERYETFAEVSPIGTLSAAGRPRTIGAALTARW